MLRRLNFENFKSWRDVTIDFGKITGLFGTNSSGKSSLIQFLLLLKQTKDATDRATTLELGGPYADLRSYRNLVFNHNEKRNLSWQLQFLTPELLRISDARLRRMDQLIQTHLVTLQAEVESRNGSPRSKMISYTAGGLRFSLRAKGSESSYELNAEMRRVRILADAPRKIKKFEFKRYPGRVWQLPGPIKSYAFPDQVRTYYRNAAFLSDLEASYEEQLDRIYYLGPLRVSSKREYVWARSKPSDVGTRGEATVEAILAATITNEKRNVRHKSRLLNFQEVIAYWLKEMGLLHSFRVEEIGRGTNLYQARVQIGANSPEVSLTEVGVGVSQVLPVLTLLYYVPENATVLLEQPEIHLHPLAQARLADVIVSVAQRRNVQVVVESHSEHFILRLQRRIAEDVISSKEIKMYFCSSTKAGVSSIDELDLDLLGNILNWPKDFMGDAFGETAAAEISRIRRMKENNS
jgi:predicted ATPase